MSQILLAALASLRGRMLRSALIAATVAIGIAAALSTVALTDGLQAHVKRNTLKAGRAVSAVHWDLFYIAKLAAGNIPAKPRRIQLTWNDMADIATKFPTITVHGAGPERRTRKTPVTFVPMEIAYTFATPEKNRGEKTKTTLVGTTPDYARTIGYGLVAGRFLTDADLRGAEPVCVLDGGTARGLWGAGVDFKKCVGRRVKFTRGKTELKARVVGVLEEPYILRERFKSFDTARHSRPAVFSRLNLMNFYVPITLITARPGPEDKVAAVGGVKFRAKDLSTGMLMYYGDAANADIEAHEKRVRRYTEEKGIAVFILPQWFWLGLIGDLLGEADIAGNVIWVVILAVAVVMIMVVNLVVVRERFREVAIRRTEGARRRDILLQFMAESCMVSLLGGVLGMGAGVAAARLLSEYVTSWPPRFSAASFLIALLASLVIGVLSTVIPAYQAARLDPVRVLSRR